MTDEAREIEKAAEEIVDFTFAEYTAALSRAPLDKRLAVARALIGPEWAVVKREQPKALLEKVAGHGLDAGDRPARLLVAAATRKWNELLKAAEEAK